MRIKTEGSRARIVGGAHGRWVCASRSRGALGCDAQWRSALQSRSAGRRDARGRPRRSRCDALVTAKATRRRNETRRTPLHSPLFCVCLLTYQSVTNRVSQVIQFPYHRGKKRTIMYCYRITDPRTSGVLLFVSFAPRCNNVTTPKITV